MAINLERVVWGYCLFLFFSLPEYSFHMFWNSFFASLGLPDSDSGAKDDRWTDGRVSLKKETLKQMCPIHLFCSILANDFHTHNCFSMLSMPEGIVPPALVVSTKPSAHACA